MGRHGALRRLYLLEATTVYWTILNGQNSSGRLATPPHQDTSPYRDSSITHPG